MKNMFLTSYVFPYIECDTDCRGGYWIMAEVNWNRQDGKLDHYGRRICFGHIHDDDYIDQEKLLNDMWGKTIYEANKIFERRFKDYTF